VNGLATLSNVSLGTIAATTYATGISASFIGDASYSASTGSSSLTVNKKPLTIAAANQTKVYGTALTLGVTTTATDFTASGLVNGNTVASVSLASTGAAATTAASSTGYDITPSAATAATGTDLNNYSITYATTGKLVVAQKPLTITAANQSKTYGLALTFAGTEFTASGLANGETAGTVTLASAGAAAAATVTTYPSTPSAVTDAGTFKASNYSLTYVAGTLTVAQAPATISLTSADLSQFYSGSVKIVGAAASPAAAGVQVAYNPTAPTTVGIYAVSATLTNTNYKLVDASNQPLTSVTGTLGIKQVAPAFANLTANQTISYGTASITLAGKLSVGSLYPTGSVTASINSIAASATLAADGTFSITYDTHALPARATAYAITYSYGGDTNFSSASDATTTLKVDQVTPVITWTSLAAIKYGTDLTGKLNAMAKVNGTEVAGTYLYKQGTTVVTSATVLNAQPTAYALSVDFTPTSSNYAPASGSNSILVQPADQTITWAVPVAISYGIALSSAQLNASTSGDGALTYSP